MLSGSDTVVASEPDYFWTAAAPININDNEATRVAANVPSIKEVLIDSYSPEMITWVLSVNQGAYLDISFNDVVTGNDELVFFFAGVTNAAGDVQITFDFDIFDTSGNVFTGDNFRPDNLAIGVVDKEGTNSTLTAATIALDAFGLAPDQELDKFRIYLANNGTFPALADVGYIAAVPLPLPIVLFASGLGVLGLFGRRKTH